MSMVSERALSRAVRAAKRRSPSCLTIRTPEERTSLTRAHSSSWRHLSTDHRTALITLNTGQLRMVLSQGSQQVNHDLRQLGLARQNYLTMQSTVTDISDSSRELPSLNDDVSALTAGLTVWRTRHLTCEASSDIICYRKCPANYRRQQGRMTFGATFRMTGSSRSSSTNYSTVK